MVLYFSPYFYVIFTRKRRRCPGARIYSSRPHSLDDTRRCLWCRSRPRLVGAPRPGRSSARHLHRPSFLSTQCHRSPSGQLLYLYRLGGGGQKTRSRLRSRSEIDVARVQNWSLSVLVGSQENCRFVNGVVWILHCDPFAVIFLSLLTLSPFFRFQLWIHLVTW